MGDNLPRLEVVARDEHVVVLRQLNQPGDEGVLWTAVDVRAALQNRRGGVNSGLGDLTQCRVHVEGHPIPSTRLQHFTPEVPGLPSRLSKYAASFATAHCRVTHSSLLMLKPIGFAGTKTPSLFLHLTSLPHRKHIRSCLNVGGGGGRLNLRLVVLNGLHQALFRVVEALVDFLKIQVSECPKGVQKDAAKRMWARRHVHVNVTAAYVVSVRHQSSVIV